MMVCILAKPRLTMLYKTDSTKRKLMDFPILSLSFYSLSLTSSNWLAADVKFVSIR